MTAVRALEHAPAGPAPSAELCTVAELSHDGPHGMKSQDRIRRHLADGSLHGHRERDRRGVRWSIALVVAKAWKAGAEPDEQRALCPLCELLPSVRATRTRTTPTAGGGSVTHLPRQRRPRRGS